MARKTLKKTKSRKKARKTPPTKSPPAHRAAPSTPAFELPFSPTALVNGLLQGNFKHLSKELSGLRSMADRKKQDIQAQLLLVRRDVSQRLREAARKDLKKVQGRIRELAVRVGRLESLLKNT